MTAAALYDRRVVYVDKELWRYCQQLVYPKTLPSHGHPYEGGFSPRKRPASWLYHELVSDPDLRRRFGAP